MLIKPKDILPIFLRIGILKNANEMLLGEGQRGIKCSYRGGNLLTKLEITIAMKNGFSFLFGRN